MKSNINRQREIFKGVLPPEGTKEHSEAIINIQKYKQNNPEFKEFTKKNWKKVNKSLEFQCLSKCDFITENTLRHYLTEFNIRAWKHGLRSMPMMFNIMEAFFNYRKPEIYFELIEEENYLISFFDFIDFLTSKDFEENKELIEENLTSDIIYNFNVSKDQEKIKFKTEKGEEYIVAGVSIIRRKNEVSVLMITGRQETDKDSIDKNPFSFETINPNKTKLIEEFKETNKKNHIKYEYLDEEKKFIKVLVACRIDLDTMTIDARYVAQEKNIMFSVVTDEIDGFLNYKGEFISKEFKTGYFESQKIINEFDAIFEVIKLSLYLPYFFNLNEEIIIEEILDTKLKEQFRSPITRSKEKDVFGQRQFTKALYFLDSKNVFSPDTIKLRDDLFKVQSSGYWKKLSLDEIGSDKKGNPIHGKTWVNQNLSWFEAKEDNLIVSKDIDTFKGENAGFIYILRNPTMEKNIFKIGRTRNEVEERAKQLSKTSVPDRFYISQEWNVKDCIKAEIEIHKRLTYYRVDPRREFFKIDYDKAVKIIKEVVDEINK